MTDDVRDRVMVDIETLGVEPGAAILSVGAVRFDLDGLGQEFYRSVDLASCQDAGLEIDAGTLEWWLDQDEDVQHALIGGYELDRVLSEFDAFYEGSREIWAFSPSFDCAILEAAYDSFDRRTPWSYRDERDCRTLVSLPLAADVEMEGKEHDALDDAKHQARVAGETLRRIERADAELGGWEGVSQHG